MTFDEHPELAGYEPMRAPLRGPRRLLVMRIVVVLGVVALVLPGILITISIAGETATSTCTVYVSRYEPNATSSSAHFDLFGPAGPGWQCYALNTEGDATFVAPLGLIPSTPHTLP